jgi:hypothetical protein
MIDRKRVGQSDGEHRQIGISSQSGSELRQTSCHASYQLGRLYSADTHVSDVPSRKPPCARTVVGTELLAIQVCMKNKDACVGDHVSTQIHSATFCLRSIASARHHQHLWLLYLYVGKQGDRIAQESRTRGVHLMVSAVHTGRVIIRMQYSGLEVC